MPTPRALSLFISRAVIHAYARARARLHALMFGKSVVVVSRVPARSPITGATVCAQILIIPRPDTCHVTGVHACAPIYTRARLTVSSISPRCALVAGEILSVFSSPFSLSSRESARVSTPVRLACRCSCTHAVTRAQARARLLHRAVTFRRLHPHLATAPTSSRAYLFPRLSLLPTPRPRTAAMRWRRDAFVVRKSAYRRIIMST